MRDLTTLRAEWQGAERHREEKVAALMATLHAAGKASLAVSELRTAWVRPQLHVSADPLAPEAPRSLLDAPTTATRSEMDRCTKVLAGTALAAEMLATAPSIETWDRAHDLIRFVSWTAFVHALADHRSLPAAQAWVPLLATPPEEETYLDGALAPEREAIRQASLAWRAAPRLLGQGRDRGHAPLGSSYVTRLAVLAYLDPAAWFDALRAAPSRTEVEFAITSASQHPDRLLDLLGAAPPALDVAGNETGHVAAIVLARRAWRYAEEVDGLLESRTRIAWADEKRSLADGDVRAFREQELAPWFDRVWGVMAARPDGAALALALVVENVAQRTYAREGRPPSEVARRADDDLENRTAAIWRPRIANLAPLLDGADLGRSLGPLSRWLAFSRIAIDDAGDQAEGARLAWARLVGALTDRGAGRDLAPGIEYVAPDTWLCAGLVLAMQQDPSAAFAALFADLWTEREQAFMGVRRATRGSDLPADASSSRFALAVAAHALTLLPQTFSCDAARVLWLPLLDGLREMWLRYEDHRGENRRVAQWVFTCGGAAHRYAVTRDPRDPGLRAELEDALGYVEMDSRLALRIASSWLANGWPAADVLDFFGRARIDLRAVCGALAAEPDEWRGDHREDLNLVRQAIDSIRDDGRPSHMEPE